MPKTVMSRRRLGGAEFCRAICLDIFLYLENFASGLNFEFELTGLSSRSFELSTVADLESVGLVVDESSGVDDSQS